MPKFVIFEGNENKDNVPTVEVADFAEATWYLAQDLINTAGKEFGVDIFREWLNLGRDSGKPQLVTKDMGDNSTHPVTFMYDPS